jgi:hypothetical protein
MLPATGFRKRLEFFQSAQHNLTGYAVAASAAVESRASWRSGGRVTCRVAEKSDRLPVSQRPQRS